MSDELRRAREAIRGAEAILVGAGAGMGVDSGLPDFRGNEGFWKAYPPFREAGLSFVDLANPVWFDRDPTLAWGFYGHRLELYRSTQPHAGFEILRNWFRNLPGGGFVFTSNVDGQFQKAGFSGEHILECHGSIHHLQCVVPCCEEIWENDRPLRVDSTSFRALELPGTCPSCQAGLRPNILMFGDGRWVSRREQVQESRFLDWLRRVERSRLVIVEVGAGSAVPTVRRQCESLAQALDAPLVRINPRESGGPPGTLGLALGAREALEMLNSEDPG